MTLLTMVETPKSSRGPGFYRIPDALVHPWHKPAVALLAFDLNADQRIDFFLREDHYQGISLKDLKPDIRKSIQQRTLQWNQFYFTPVDDKTIHNLTEILHGSISAHPPPQTILPQLGVAALALASPPLRIGTSLVAAATLLADCGDPRCAIPEMDCEAIDKACSQEGSASITILKNINDILDKWRKEGQLSSEIIFEPNILWDFERKGIQLGVYDPPKKQAALIFEPIEDPNYPPQLIVIPDEAEIEGRIKWIVPAAHRVVLANDGKRIIKIGPDGKTDTIKSISLGTLIGLFFNNKKNEIWTMRSQHYFYEDLQRPLIENSWIGIDVTERPWGGWTETFYSMIDIDSKFFIIHSSVGTDSGGLWLLGRKLYEGETSSSPTDYRLVFAQKDANQKVQAEIRWDILEAIGNFFQTTFRELKVSMVGIDHHNRTLLFRVIKANGESMKNWDAGLIAVNSQTLAVKRLASPFNFSKAFGIRCDHTSILNYVGSNLEKAKQMFRNMRIQTVVPIDQNKYLAVGGILVYQLELPDIK